MKAFRALLGVTLLLLAAVPAMADEVESEATVKNKSPKFAEVEFETEDDDPSTPGLQIIPTPGESRVLKLRASVDDDNGHRDVRKMTATLKKGSSVLEGPKDGAEEDDSRGRRAKRTASFTLDPQLPAGEYAIDLVTEDRPGDRDSTTVTFEILEILAMSVEGSVSFGDLQPGATTSAVGVKVRNLGNVRIDLEVAGTDLVSSEASIPISYLKVGLSSGDANQALASTPLQLSSFDLDPVASAEKSVYLRLQVPSGDEQYVPQGDYRGTVTLSAVVDG